MCEQLQTQYAWTKNVVSKLLKNIKRKRKENVFHFLQKVTHLVRNVYPEPKYCTAETTSQTRARFCSAPGVLIGLDTLFNPSRLLGGGGKDYK